MPAVSQAQHAMMLEDLRRLKAGESTRTGMSQEQLEEYVASPADHLPERLTPKKGRHEYRS